MADVFVLYKLLPQGYNGTIFAYGQTGSGKTFSMYGPDLRDTIGTTRGIVPRAIGQVFQGILSGTHHDVEEFMVKCSYLELYNEMINDLLDPAGKNLKIRQSPTKGIYIANLTWECVQDEEDIFELLELGAENRHTAATKMNDRSSRSHCIFMMDLIQKKGDGSILESRLNLVDLAGSESVKKTGATGSTFKEAQKINLSLSALGKCIFALTDKKTKHIPFRDSKLTRILQESLGGNSRTTLIVCLSPHHDNFDETVGTLRFAERAKKITTKARVNEMLSPEMMAKTIKALKAEVQLLKKKNLQLNDIIDRIRAPEWDREKEPIELLLKSIGGNTARALKVATIDEESLGGRSVDDATEEAERTDLSSTEWECRFKALEINLGNRVDELQEQLVSTRENLEKSEAELDALKDDHSKVHGSGPNFTPTFESMPNISVCIRPCRLCGRNQVKFLKRSRRFRRLRANLRGWQHGKKQQKKGGPKRKMR